VWPWGGSSTRGTPVFGAGVESSASARPRGATTGRPPWLDDRKAHALGDRPGLYLSIRIRCRNHLCERCGATLRGAVFSGELSLHQGETPNSFSMSFHHRVRYARLAEFREVLSDDALPWPTVREGLAFVGKVERLRFYFVFHNGHGHSPHASYRGAV
jgi:hypothetical protein